jgi:N-carbamoyl-L-amino-acid hydrolase
MKRTIIISIFVGTLVTTVLPIDRNNRIDVNHTGKNLRVNSKRIEYRISELSKFGRIPQGGINRVAFSEADIQARQYIMSLMPEAGMKVRIDAAGNIIGRREGRSPKLPALLMGSHIDSVPQGGNYDGALGVIAAIECVLILHENNIITRHPLEVVVFSDEEGGLVGSRTMIGKMTAQGLEVVSHSGKTVRQGIQALGGNPERLPGAIRGKGDIKSFIEVHIEQGSFLDSGEIDIGVVQGIVGIQWWDITIEGVANHAGTTPMNKRHDALLTAAHLIIAVNKVVTSVPGRQVGTVGRIKAEPGAPNVIPGKVLMSLEIRDLEEKKINTLYEKIKKEAGALAQRFGTRISFTPIDAKSIPAPMDKRVIKVISESAGELGYSYKFMPSGAGHDAQNMAVIVPTGLIFVPSVGGISHSPKEYTRAKDMVNGANVLLQSILKIDMGAVDK